MRSSWIDQVGPKSNDQHPYGDIEEIRVMQPQAMECLDVNRG